MKQIEKKYDKDGIVINTKIHLGFDENLLLNHPSSFEDVVTLLFMFIPNEELNEELAEWFFKNENKNNYISVMMTKYVEDEFDEIVKIVDLVMDKYDVSLKKEKSEE